MERLLRSGVVRFAGAALLAGALAGCGSNSSTSPTPTVGDLAGNWSGSIGSPLLGLPLTWNATQNGASVTGPSTISLMAGLPSVTGTMTGTISGTQVALTMNFPSNVFPPFANTCSLTGSGTASTASATQLSGPFNVTVGSGCVAYFGAAQTYQGTLDLRK